MTDSKKTIPVMDGTLQKLPCKDETIPTLIDIQEQIDAFAKVSSTLHEYELLDKTIQLELSQVQHKFQEWKQQVITAQPDIAKEFYILQTIKSYEGCDDETGKLYLGWCNDRKHQLVEALRGIYATNSQEEWEEFALECELDQRTDVFHTVSESFDDGNYDWIFDYQCGFVSSSGCSDTTSESIMKGVASIYLSYIFQDYLELPQMDEEEEE